MDKKILGIILLGLSLVVSFMSFRNATRIIEKDGKEVTEHIPLMYVIAVFSLIMCVYLLWNILNMQPELIEVDRDEATKFYIWWLERNRKISVPDYFGEEFFDDPDNSDWFRMVLKWTDKVSKKPLYAPIEIYKFYVSDADNDKKIKLGHGRGKITDDYNEVQYFILKNADSKKSFETKAVLKPIIEELIDVKLKERNQ